MKSADQPFSVTHPVPASARPTSVHPTPTQPETVQSKTIQPTALDKLVELVASADAKTERVIESIHQHEGLAEAIVNRANSPEFALRHQISRVEHALAVLGLRRTVDTINKFQSATLPPRPHFLKNGDRSN